MNFYFKIILFILGISSGWVKAQKSQSYIQGTLIDSTSSLPVSNANIFIGKTKYGTSSDKFGHFKIKIDKFPVVLQISHVSYQSQAISLDGLNTKLTVFLVRKNHELPVVVVSADRVVNLVAKKLFAVNDYEFMGKNILMLVYNYNYSKFKNPWLVLMNPSGDTLCSANIGIDGSLYRDCMDNIYLVTENRAFQILYDSLGFELQYSARRDDFFKALEPCITNIGNHYYLKNFSYNNQVLTYFISDIRDTSYKEMRVISDNAGLKMLASRGRFHDMSATPVTEADIRFENMCFFDPVFAPMFKIKQQIVIFNTVDSKIEFFSEKGELERDFKIQFHKLPHWKEEIIFDEINNKAYTLYVKDGITSIREISLDEGGLGKPVKIPKFKFVSKIKIHENKVYFLYRKAATDDLMALYVMELDI